MSKGFAKMEQSISDGRSANKLRSFLLTRLLLSHRIREFKWPCDSVPFDGAPSERQRLKRHDSTTVRNMRARARQLSKYDTGSSVFPSGRQ